MAFIDDIASKLSGRTRAETNNVMTDATTRTYVGTATSASEDGSVYVTLSQDVTLPDDDDGEHGLGVEMPTTVAVDEGDEVLVTVFGGGVMKAPVVTGNPGWGDTIQTQVDSAETVAEEAAEEVEQVRQDVADFRDDVATTYATKVEREDGDDAVKTWVTTNYTNSNDLATTYATKTLVSQTKDAIELAASQTYETQSDAAATYATKAALTVGLDGIRSEVAEDYQPKGDYATTASMNSAIQQSASSIESSVAATYETKSDASTTYATKTEVQQTASGLDTRITTAQSTADGAYLERTATGTTIDTTGAATIRSLVVEGKSVQDGTPSPSAPVPIVSVEGRNLLPSNYVSGSQTYQGLTWTINGDGTLTCSGTATANGYYVLYGGFANAAPVPSWLVEGRTYGFGDGYTDISSDHGMMMVYFYSGTSALLVANQRTSNNFTVPSGATSFGVFIRFENGKALNTTFYPRITARTYAMYTPYGSIGIGTEGSLVDFSSGATVATGTEVVDDNGIVTVSASRASGWSFAYWSTATEEGARYILSATASGTSPRIMLAFNDEPNASSFIRTSQLSEAGDRSVTAVSPSGANYVQAFLYARDSVSGTASDASSYEYPRLVKDGMLPYIPLQGHALRSLPDGTHDTLVIDSAGNVTLTKRIESYTINASSLNAPLYTVNGRECTPVLSFSDISRATGEVLLCDRAVVKSRVAELTVGTVYKNPANVLLVGDTDSTIDDLREMYGGATIYYPLATPQTIDLGTIDIPTPADTLWLDAAIVPTIEATWWTVDGIAGQQALDAEVTERQTLIRQFSGGVLAGYVGNAIAALVNAAGSFDVVRTAWTDGVPSILGTLARYAASGISLFDAAGNVLAEFASDHVRIGGEFADSGRSTARVQFFGDSSALTDLTAEHYVNQTVEPMVSHGLALSSTTTDEDLPDSTSRTVTGNVEVWEQIYNDGNDYSDEVDVSLTGATTNRLSAVSVGAKAVESTGNVFSRIVYAIADTLRLTYGTGEQTSVNDIPLQQAIVGLRQPEATYTGSDTTATASSSGWTISHMNNVQGDSGVSDYFTFSNGVITALRDELLEISGVAYWNSGAVGQYGFGFFIGSSTVSSGTEKSVFSYKASASGQFSVTMPPRCVPVTAGTKIAVARYSINGSVYRNGTNMSFVTIRVVQDRSS